MKDLKDREDIVQLIDAFYEKVRVDETLGPIFNDVMQVNWATHLPKMYDFWENTLFHRPTYKGNPMQVHQKVHAQSPLLQAQFDVWLRLFRATVDELFAGEMAHQAKVRALSIATVMQIKISQGEEGGLPIAGSRT